MSNTVRALPTKEKNDHWGGSSQGLLNCVLTLPAPSARLGAVRGQGLGTLPLLCLLQASTGLGTLWILSKLWVE